MSPLSPDLTPSLEVFLGNLLAWSLQLGLATWAAVLLTQAFPLERPGPRLRLFQGLLVVGLVLPLLQPWRATLDGVGWSLAAVSSASSPLATTPGPAGPEGAPTFPWAAATTLALLAGVILQVGRLGIGLIRLRRIRLTAQAMRPAAWLDDLRSRVAPSARLVTSDRCGGPATFGVLRPTIVLPPAFDALPRERQRAVALHELIHARSCHWLVLVGEELVKAVLFFHPAVHWLLGRIRLAREQCVDAEVVRSLGGRQAYLESLVEVARLSASSVAVPAAPFLRERHLRERVELLLKEVSMSRARSWVHIGLTAGALVLAGALAVAAFPMLTTASPAGVPSVGEDTTRGTNDFEPKLVHRVQPTYPKGAKEDRAQGRFVIRVKINEKGEIADARVIVSTPVSAPGPNDSLMDKEGTPEALQGDKRLAQAALEAVRQWRFEPVLDEDGKPKAAEAVLTVRFKLT